MSELFGVPFLPSYDLATARGILALLLAMALVGLCIHLSARTLIKKDNIHRAFSASALGVLLALLGMTVVAPAFWIVGLLLAILAFVAAIGLAYSAKPQGAVAVGAATWVLWIVANFAIRYVQDHWN